MSLGRRRRERQLDAFIAASDPLKFPDHPFYTALNRLLAEHGFDALVEKLCAGQRVGFPVSGNMGVQEQG